MNLEFHTLTICYTLANISVTCAIESWKHSRNWWVVDDMVGSVRRHTQKWNVLHVEIFAICFMDWRQSAVSQQVLEAMGFLFGFVESYNIILDNDDIVYAERDYRPLWRPRLWDLRANKLVWPSSLFRHHNRYSSFQITNRCSHYHSL